MAKSALKHHSPFALFKTKDHCLQVGGRSVVDIAQEHADTPIYIYDRDVIKNKIDLLRKHLPSTMHIHYAIKANPMPAVVQYIHPLVEGLDVASGKELEVALASGMDAAEISFAGPGKNVNELEKIILLQDRNREILDLMSCSLKRILIYSCSMRYMNQRMQ